MSFHMIQATYKTMQGQGTHVSHLALACFLAASLSSSLMTGTWGFTSIFLSNCFCANFSLSSRIRSLICLACSQQKSWIKEHFNITHFFFFPFLLTVLLPKWTFPHKGDDFVILERLSQQSIFSNEFIFNFFCGGGKQATLTLSKAVSFSSSSLCMKGWQSCWQ